MVSTKIRWNNTWVDLNPGKLRIRDGGGWVDPSNVKVRVQDPPGTGPFVWKDLNYTTSPRVPTSFGVSSSDYGTVNVTWGAPASGGSPPAYYEAVMDYESNNRAATVTTGGGSASFAVNTDTRYKFYVRSVAANGLFSAWAGPIQYAIGHPQQTSTRTVQRSRGWQSATASVGLYNQVIDGATAPARSTAYGFETGVVVTDVYMYVMSGVFGETYGAFREAFWLGNGAADIGGVMQPFNTGLPYGPSWVVHPFRGRWSNGQPWGIWLNGEGYDNKYGQPPMYCNTTLAGTEYYAADESYVSVSAVGNGPW